MDTKAFIKKLVELFGTNWVSISQNADYVFVKLAYYDPTMAYSDTEIARISKHDRASYVLDLTSEVLDTTHSAREKVADIVTAYANTPIAKRDSKKYNVIIANDGSSQIPFLAWVKDSEKTYLYWVDKEALCDDRYTQFTESEYQDLINYIKALPNGEVQAKTAELGKVEVGDAK